VWHIDGFNSLLEMQCVGSSYSGDRGILRVSILYWRCKCAKGPERRNRRRSGFNSLLEMRRGFQERL